MHPHEARDRVTGAVIRLRSAAEQSCIGVSTAPEIPRLDIERRLAGLNRAVVCADYLIPRHHKSRQHNDEYAESLDLSMSGDVISKHMMRIRI